jgi:cytochrome d ubiquinol oxidase subunit II
MALIGTGLFTNLLYSSPHPEHSLSIYNSSSSQWTLGIKLTIALIGVPWC